MGVTVNQHTQHQSPETEAAKYNPAIINCIIHSCGFSYHDMTKCLLLRGLFFLDTESNLQKFL